MDHKSQGRSGAPREHHCAFRSPFPPALPHVRRGTCTPVLRTTRPNWRHPDRSHFVGPCEGIDSQWSQEADRWRDWTGRRLGNSQNLWQQNQQLAASTSQKFTDNSKDAKFLRGKTVKTTPRQRVRGSLCLRERPHRLGIDVRWLKV